MNQKKPEKYILIGPYPPPLGGVSVFIYRYYKVLKSQGIEVQILDWEKLNWVQKIGWLTNIVFNPQKTTYNINGFLVYILFCLLLRPFQKKIIFIDHSFRGIDQLSGIKRMILNKFLTTVDEYVLVGEHLRQYYSDSGYRLPANTMVRNAFLPPPLEDEEQIWKSYDPSTLEFINNHSPVIIANAYQITIYNEVDLYGIDMCIAETALLKKEYPNIGFLFALAEIGNFEVYEKYLRQIELLGISENFHFMSGQKELWPLFKKADLMIRPTSSDGYGISVSEALYFGCPAIASDVCERAEGTILFKNRDADDLHLRSASELKKITLGFKNKNTGKE